MYGPLVDAAVPAHEVIPDGAKGIALEFLVSGTQNGVLSVYDLYREMSR
jgi:hypothetical protein